MDSINCNLCSSTEEDFNELDCFHTLCQKCVSENITENEDENPRLCPMCSWPIKEDHEGNESKFLVREAKIARIVRWLSKQNRESVVSAAKEEDVITDIVSELRRVKLSTEDLEDSGYHNEKKRKIKEKIDDFYKNLILDVTNYITEQHNDVLFELESVFEHYVEVHSGKKKTRQQLVKSLDTKINLFSTLYTNKGENMMEEFYNEMTLYTERCKALFEKLKVEVSVDFVEGHDQKESVLSTSFGALIKTCIYNRFHHDACLPLNYPQRDTTTASESDGTTYSEENETTSSESTPQPAATLNFSKTNTRDGTDRDAENILVNNNDRKPDSISDSNAVADESSRRNVMNTASVSNDHLINSDSSVLAEEPPPTYLEAIASLDSLNPSLSQRLSSSSIISSGRIITPSPVMQILDDGRNQFQFPTTTVYIPSALTYAKHERSIRTNLPDDSKMGPIVSIAWIQENLIFVDKFNRKLKLYNDKGQFLHCLCFADSEPWDVCTMNTVETFMHPVTCAVTLPKTKQILIVRVEAGRRLVIFHQMTSRTGYTCLAYDKGHSTLVCGVSSPFGTAGIHIISPQGPQGVFVREFVLPQQLLVRSIDISFDGVMTVCDWRKNTVEFLNSDGFLIGSYKGTEQFPLKEPCGTTFDGRGHVMVSDGKSNNIHILTNTGKLYCMLKSSCPIIRPKEINVRLDGPPKLALSHGSIVEIFNLMGENDRPAHFPIVSPAPISVPSAPPML